MKIRKLPFIYIVALLYFIFSFTLIYLKWRAHTPSLDYHAYLQMFWNTANGDIMMYNRSSESQYSLFSAHFAPFLLLIFPFYVLVKHPLTLFFFAFFFLHRKKPWLYLIFSVLTLSLRINMVLPVFLLGFYSVIKKRARS